MGSAAGPPVSALLGLLLAELADAWQEKRSRAAESGQAPYEVGDATPGGGFSPSVGLSYDQALARAEAEEDRLHALAFADDEQLLDHDHHHHHHPHCGCED